MFTANREPRSFSLWLGVFTPYKKKSAGSAHPKQAGQGCWHKLQTQTTCAQGTKIIYRWSIAYLSFSVNGLPLWVGTYSDSRTCSQESIFRCFINIKAARNPSCSSFYRITVCFLFNASLFNSRPSTANL